MSNVASLRGHPETRSSPFSGHQGDCATAPFEWSRNAEPGCDCRLQGGNGLRLRSGSFPSAVRDRRRRMPLASRDATLDRRSGAVSSEGSSGLDTISLNSPALLAVGWNAHASLYIPDGGSKCRVLRIRTVMRSPCALPTLRQQRRAEGSVRRDEEFLLTNLAHYGEAP